MARPGIEPRFPRLLANTLPTRPNNIAYIRAKRNHSESEEKKWVEPQKD